MDNKSLLVTKEWEYVIKISSTTNLLLVSEVPQAVVEDKLFYSSSPIFEKCQEQRWCGCVTGVKQCKMKEACKTTDT